MKLFQAPKLNLEYLYLFDREVRGVPMGFALKNFNNEKREGAFMWGHGAMQNFWGQVVTKLTARNDALRVPAGMGTPRDECGMFLWCCAMIAEIAIWQHCHDFRIGGLPFKATFFKAIAEDVCLKFHEGKNTS